MATEVKAVFSGDIGPANQAMAQLRRAMAANAQAMAKDLTLRPQMDPNAVLAATANIKAHLKQWAATPIKGPAIQFDLSKSTAYLDQAFAKAAAAQNSLASRAQRGGAIMGGGNRLNMGGAALQIQDIAVQLQMGQQLSTIIAQQGSQMASMFGPTGMLVGGALAVGGALVTVGQNSKKAFAELIAGADAAHASLQRLGSTSSLSELSAAMTQIADVRKQLDADSKLGQSFTGVASVGLGVLMGGKDFAERRDDRANAEARLDFDQRRLERSAVEAARQQVQIANLRAQGRDKEAAAIERQIALQRTLAEIESSSYSPAVKQQLSAAAREQSKAEGTDGTAAAAERVKSAAEEHRLTQAIIALRKQLKADRTEGMTGGDRLIMLERQAAAMRNDAVLGALATTEDEALKRVRGGDLRGGESSLRWLAEYERTIKEIESVSESLKQQAIEEAKARTAAADAAREEQRAFEAMVDAENARIADEQSQQATQNARTLADRASSLADTTSNAMLTNLRAHGHDRRAERMESRLGLEQKKAALMADGLTEAQAARAAQGMQRDEDKLAGRRSTIGRAMGDASTRRQSPMEILRNASASAAKKAEAAARESAVSIREGAEIIAQLRELNTKLKILN